LSAQQAKNQYDLEVKKDDIIHVFKKDGDTWYGEISGRVGCFLHKKHTTPANANSNTDISSPSALTATVTPTVLRRSLSIGNDDESVTSETVSNVRHSYSSVDELSEQQAHIEEEKKKEDTFWCNLP